MIINVELSGKVAYLLTIAHRKCNVSVTTDKLHTNSIRRLVKLTTSAIFSQSMRPLNYYLSI